MRASHIAVRAALVLGAAGAGIALWSAADATAAYADHRPAAAEQPGGLLDGLPEQAADHAQDVVHQVVPDKPKRDEPAADEPREDPQPPAAPVVEVPPIQVPPVAVETPPALDPVLPVVTTPPVVIVPAPTEPAPADPIVITLPDAGDIPVPAVPQLPLPAPVSLIGGLAVLIAPAPATAPPVDIRHDHPAKAAGPLEVVDCDDQADPLDMTAPGHRIKRIHPRAAHLAAPGRAPCDPAGGQDLAAHLADVTAPSQSGGQLAATVPAGASLPAVTERLSRLLPRSDLTSSRTAHLDPRPA